MPGAAGPGALRYRCRPAFESPIHTSCSRCWRATETETPSVFGMKGFASRQGARSPIADASLSERRGQGRSQGRNQGRSQGRFTKDTLPNARCPIHQRVQRNASNYSGMIVAPPRFEKQVHRPPALAAAAPGRPGRCARCAIPSLIQGSREGQPRTNKVRLAMRCTNRGTAACGGSQARQRGLKPV